MNTTVCRIAGPTGAGRDVCTSASRCRLGARLLPREPVFGPAPVDAQDHAAESGGVLPVAAKPIFGKPYAVCRVRRSTARSMQSRRSTATASIAAADGRAIASALRRGERPQRGAR